MSAIAQQCVIVVVQVKIYKPKELHLWYAVPFQANNEMDVLNKLVKPYLGLAQLSLGYHKIESFRAAKTSYGESVIAELENEVIFLPKFLVQKLGEKEIADLNDCKEPLYLYFGGMHETKK